MLESYLSNRKVRTRVNGVFSEWSPDNYINSGVPQGSILGPLLFLLYINDLPDVIRSTCYIYADDTSIYLPVPRSEYLQIYHDTLQADLNSILEWANDWKLIFKPSKTREVVFKSRVNLDDRPHPILTLDNNNIERVTSHIHLGVILDQHLNWREHFNYIRCRADKMLNPLTALKSRFTSKHLATMYTSFILPVVEYGSILYSGASIESLSNLDKVHYRAALIVSGCIHGTNTNKLFKTLGWRALGNRRDEKLALLMQKTRLGLVPSYVRKIYVQVLNRVIRPGLRVRNYYRVPEGSAKYKNTPAMKAITKWNSLPDNVQTSPNISIFKSRFNKNFHDTYLKSTLTTKVNLTRVEEIKLNKFRSDLAVRVDFKRHNFLNYNDVRCSCGFHRETKRHILLNCPIAAPARGEMIRALLELDDFNIMIYYGKNQEQKINLILYGDKSLSDNLNRKLIRIFARFINDIID